MKPRPPERPGRRPEQGAALVLFALSVTLILVLAAIVVGLGNARQVDRDLQNDVDAAVLAAAVDLDGLVGTNDFATAKGTACAYLRANDYELTAAECDALSFSYPVDPDGNPNPVGVECLGLKIDGEADVWFGGVMGDNIAELRAQAIGCRTQGGAGSPPTDGPDVPAAFAGGQNCDGSDPGFDSSGNLTVFDGEIHANDNPKDGGTDNSTTDPDPTYVGNIVQAGSLWQVPPATSVGSQPWPNGFDPTTLTVGLYQPGGARALAYGDFYDSTHGQTFSGNVLAGVYYRTGSFEIGSINIVPRTGDIYLDPATGLPAKPVANGGTGVLEENQTLDGITLVSGDGEVYMSTDGVHLEHFEYELNRLVIFTNWDGNESSSGKWCTTPVTNFGGKDCIHFDGVIYAPRGAVELNGNGNGNDHNDRGGCGARHDWSGGIISYGVKFNGERHYLRGGPGSLIPGSPSGDGRVFLGS